MDFEPLSRINHFAAGVEGRLYVWGGKIKDYSTSDLEIFNTHKETWDIVKRVAKGSPPGVNWGACASSDQYIYTYGGSEGVSLNQLDTKTCTWTQLTPHNNGGPMKKSACGMVFYQNKLVLFDGDAGDSPTGSTQPGASYEYGDTNELHVFDLNEDTWSSPKVEGTRPPPCRGFSFTMINDHRAVLFGGYKFDGQRKFINDTYILDLKIMNWIKLINHDGAPSPVGRYNHAAVCLNYFKDNPDNPQLLVTGGLDEKEVLSDAWILDIKSEKWMEILLHEDQKRLLKRCHHSAVSFSHGPKLTKVVIFGGCDDSSISMSHYIAHTTLLRFECKTATGQWPWVLTGHSRQRSTLPLAQQQLDN